MVIRGGASLTLWPRGRALLRGSAPFRASALIRENAVFNTPRRQSLSSTDQPDEITLTVYVKGVPPRSTSHTQGIIS